MPDAREGLTTAGRNRRLGALIGTTLGGTAAVLGSFLTWARFDVQFSILPMTGIDLGYGILTGLLGLAAIMLALVPAPESFAGRIRVGQVVLGCTILLTSAVVATGIQAQVIPGDLSFRSYGLGLVVTGIGGALALAASLASRRAG